ncbi:hypothetical protein LT350_27545 [Mycolicibacterium smegmatis]|uniref:hypothetical protein n=1 Tax=Mycolicibacterium smegmatis TaxID=1772 RepID=UPI001E489E89|nr:hypothetical protein [Mycolicibacterium smegmatis]UGU30248.1 hypothetical protein LT350_27545 [Mycolicibacterium smegmatis]ULN71182.1 hypothetical protein KZ782_04355 [Mycolicibacterium smegmatis]
MPVGVPPPPVGAAGGGAAGAWLLLGVTVAAAGVLGFGVVSSGSNDIGGEYVDAGWIDGFDEFANDCANCCSGSTGARGPAALAAAVASAARSAPLVPDEASPLLLLSGLAPAEGAEGMAALRF